MMVAKEHVNSREAKEFAAFVKQNYNENAFQTR